MEENFVVFWHAQQENQSLCDFVMHFQNNQASTSSKFSNNANSNKGASNQSS
jgi:hypothetical protein